MANIRHIRPACKRIAQPSEDGGSIPPANIFLPPLIQTGDILKIKDQWEQCKQYCSQLKANNYHQKTGYKYGTDLNDGRLYARWPRIGKTMTPLAHRVNARKNACSTVSATGG
jgi:hypothetical protein